MTHSAPIIDRTVMAISRRDSEHLAAVPERFTPPPLPIRQDVIQKRGLACAEKAAQHRYR